MKKYLLLLYFILFLLHGVRGQIAVGDSAINFSLPDTTGTFISLHDFAGDIIVLNFFAHWCVPCYSEAPLLEDSVWQVYQNQGVTVLGVGFQQTVENIRFFADSTHVTYPLLMDSAATVFNAYGVPFLPHNFIINQQGYIAHVDGIAGFNIPLMVHIIDSLLTNTSINDRGEPALIGKTLILSEAYPNPFNNRVNIEFQLNKSAPVNLKIFDVAGRLVIQRKMSLNRGSHTIPVEMGDFSSGL
ncbi:MAG: redoxin domain-containing protein, partial [Calditrichia bacterium]